MAGTAVQYLELLELKGRGFVVLGAGQGIGAAAAHALAQAGANVLCVDNDEGRAQDIARDVGGHACRADVMQRADMERMFREARARLGRGVGDRRHRGHRPHQAACRLSTMPPGANSSTRSCAMLS